MTGWMARLHSWSKCAPGEAGAILMYHRVVRSPLDPWRLCLSPENFIEQLEVLRLRWTVVPLTELASRVAKGRSLGGCVAITFDDGYADNLLIAAPILRDYCMPATLFLATGMVGRRREFWWDELQRLVLSSAPMPGELILTLRGRALAFRLGVRARTKPAQHAWCAEDRPRCERHRVFLQIWALLQRESDEEQQRALDQLARQIGDAAVARPNPQLDRAMTAEEVRRLASDGGFEIASHTATHPVLTRLSLGEQAIELERSREDIRRLVGEAPAGVSYPYGAVDDAVAGLAHSVGYRYGCCSMHRTASAGDQLMLLPRVIVFDWSGKEFLRVLERLY
jgi:peptidoglycan/xylan/chitin deacetylase (PgdA/CDA1 family)